ESAGGAGLAWRDALPLVLAIGEFAMPVPLAESLAAHALAGAAGCLMPDGGADSATGSGADACLAGFAGAAGVARLVCAGDALVAESVAWGDRIETVVGVDAEGGVRLLDARRAWREDTRNLAGEIRSRMSWRDAPAAEGRVRGDALAGLGAALRAA